MSRELNDNLKSARRFNEVLQALGLPRAVVVKHIPSCKAWQRGECDCTPAVLSVPRDGEEAGTP